MTETARATTVLLVGVMLVQLSISGAYTGYVRVEMGWALLATGVLLVGLGLAGMIHTLASSWMARSTGHGDHSHRGHDAGHTHSAGVAWLLLAAIVALLVAPPALGSYGLDRTTTATVAVGGQTFDPLPPGHIVPMSLLEFTQRAADNHGASFGSTPVRLTGFVAKTDDGTGIRIARYKIACCAADAAPAIVRVTGATGNPPAVDHWITVTGTFRPPTGDPSTTNPPELLASSLTEISTPANPYE